MAEQRDKKPTGPGHAIPADAGYHTPGPIPTGLIPLDNATAERLKKIGEAAYRRAQARNFAPGHDLDDWLAAEREVDGSK